MEIFQIPREKNFKGRAKFTVRMRSQNDDQTFNTIGFGVDSIDTAIADPVDLKNYLLDPVRQRTIIDASCEGLRGLWRNKMAGKTWSETRDHVLLNLEKSLDKFYENLRFELYVQYEIQLSDNPKEEVNQITQASEHGSWDFGWSAIGTARTKSELVKTFLIHELTSAEALAEVKSIIKRGIEVIMDRELEPHIESDLIRKENDIQMLKLLTKRYPNYQELLNENTESSVS